MHKAYHYIYIGFSWNREKQTTMKYKKHAKKEIVTKPISKISHYFHSLTKCILVISYQTNPAPNQCTCPSRTEINSKKKFSIRKQQKQ